MRFFPFKMLMVSQSLITKQGSVDLNEPSSDYIRIDHQLDVASKTGCQLRLNKIAFNAFAWCKTYSVYSWTEILSLVGGNYQNGRQSLTTHRVHIVRWILPQVLANEGVVLVYFAHYHLGFAIFFFFVGI